MEDKHTTTHLDDLWQFAGQGLRSADFNTAMVHFYRAEVTRANVWRQRLDTTTNWAVLTTGAALTFTFGSVLSTHIVIILDAILTLLFLLMEARRYRYYELWSYRIRLMETNFFAGLLSPPFLPSAEWADRVTSSLRHPTFPISLKEAMGRRYRRNYAPLFMILGLGWVAKVIIHPNMATNLNVILERATIGPIPGWLVILTGFLFHGSLMAIGIFTAGLRFSQGEVFDEPTNILHRIARRFRLLTWEALEIDFHLPFAFRHTHKDHLAYVISDTPKQIGAAIMENLKRGVTELHGTGMYTGNEHSVLMCVINSSQTEQLKKIVKQVDEKAFVIITDVKDVRGIGFQPLEA